MSRTLNAGLCGLALSVAAACGGATNTNTGPNANTNAANTNSVNATSGTAAPADESQIARAEAGGVVTETRTFRAGPVEKVVVTTRDGRRTARVYARETGEMRDLPEDKLDMALSATGEAVASAAGFVSEKAGDAGRTVADKAEDVGRGAVDRGKEAGSAAVDKAGDVGVAWRTRPRTPRAPQPAAPSPERRRP